MRERRFFICWRWLRLLVVASAIVAMGRAEEAPALRWADGFASARRWSAESGKMLLVVFFQSKGSQPERAFEDEILLTADFREWAASVVVVQVDPTKVDGEPMNAELWRAFGITRVPTVWVLAPDGEILGELGYMEGGPKTFIRAVRELAAEADGPSNEGTK